MTLEEELSQYLNSLVAATLATTPSGIAPQEARRIHEAITAIFRRHGEEPPPFRVHLDMATGELTIGDPPPADGGEC